MSCESELVSFHLQLFLIKREINIFCKSSQIFYFRFTNNLLICNYIYVRVTQFRLHLKIYLLNNGVSSKIMLALDWLELQHLQMQGVKSKNTSFLFKQISHLHTHTLAHTFSLLGNWSSDNAPSFSVLAKPCWHIKVLRSSGFRGKQGSSKNLEAN